MKSHRKYIEEIVFDLYKDSKYFDNVSFSMLKAYDCFMENVKSFKKLSLTTKYELCETACLIGMKSMEHQIKSVHIFKKEKIPFSKFSLFFRDEDKPDIINIKEQKKLEL